VEEAAAGGEIDREDLFHFLTTFSQGEPGNGWLAEDSNPLGKG